MKGEHKVGKKDNGLLGESEQARSHYKNLTWVKGDRNPGALDETSRKNLAGGRQAHYKKKISPSPEDWQNEGGARAGSIWHGGNSESNAKVAEVTQSGTSIFDPVLCELAYRWFCPPDGEVLDPFAGGSVRGIVAAFLGRKYTGVDLSAQQIAANEAQASAIVPDNAPRWILGDSRKLKKLAPGKYDFVFSCPPYFDLEVYSDDGADLSTAKDYARFIKDYRVIIAAAVDMLQPNRFACFVVGDIRDKKGLYRNFVADTTAAFQDAGARLYNEAVLVTSVGSLPIRVGRQFEAGRKLGKTHQNILVFIKGDPRKATEACGPVEIADLAEQFGQVALQ